MAARQQERMPRTSVLRWPYSQPTNATEPHADHKGGAGGM
jgi:hypothetical protein